MAGYCIGKATRNWAGQIVTHPPYDLFGQPPKDRYEELRTIVFDTYEEAAAAAVEATEWNPVGFVVLTVRQE